jgi:photosystem II stability/assembly factor-like uncharacterized protein
MRLPQPPTVPVATRADWAFTHQAPASRGRRGMAVSDQQISEPESGTSGEVRRPLWLVFAAGLILLVASLTAALQAPYADAYGYAQRSWWQWFASPVERNPVNRLLRVEGDIADLAMAADGRHGYAVGGGGLILVTDNGGLDWEARPVSGSYRLVDVATSSDGKVAVVISDSGAALLSGDGGQNWQPVNSLRPKKLELLDVVVAPDARRIWMVGVASSTGLDQDIVPIFLHSEDGGKNWGVINLNTSNPEAKGDIPLTVRFGLAAGEGWIGSARGVLYKTEDDGASWHSTTAAKTSVNDPTESDSGNAARLIPASYYPGESTAGLRLASFSDDEAEANKAPVQTDRAGRIIEPGVAPQDRKPFDTGKAENGAQDAKSYPEQATRATKQSAKSSIRKPARIPARKSRRIPKTSSKGGSAVLNDGEMANDAAMFASKAAAATPPEDLYLSITDFVTLSTAPYVRGISGGTYFFTLSEGGTLNRGQDLFPSSDIANPANGITFGDAEHGWAVGNPISLTARDRPPVSVILATTDGGVSWKPQYSAANTTLSAVSATDARHVWAAGHSGTILHTSDGGAHWFRQLRDPADKASTETYHRYPAPWYYAALIAAALLLWRGIRPQPVRSLKGAAAIGASDSPTMSFAQDKLQFGALARGISRYLRNSATTPPMTLAVSGDWGTGKSSLMRLVCADLETHGNRPVWFNAWHHQDQEQLLAALLATIRDEALPHWWTADGMKFRGHLFWLRAQRSLPTTLLLVGLIVALGSFFTNHDRVGWGALVKLASGGWEGISTLLGGSLAGVAALIAVIGGLYKAMKSFGSDPAVLLTNTIENFKLRDATAQINFRTRFQTQFKEVTTALPYPLVIVIDDLDRCRADTVLSVMESVNFLMSSGPCFVIFGMATERVQAALAMSFKDIAQELVTIDAGETAPDNPDMAARAKRHKYAGDYLEKLINLEVRVPTRSDIAPHLLLMQEAAGVRVSWLGMLRGLVPKLVPLALFVGVVAGAWYLGKGDVPDVKEEAKAASKTVAPAAAAEKAATPVAAPQAEAEPVPETRSARVKTEAGVDSRAHDDWPLYVLLALMLAVTGAVQFARTRAARSEVKDSDAFAEALKIWTPVVAHQASAPRSIKRFGNRIRYFAMLQQAELAEPTAEERVEDWLRGLVRRGEAVAAGPLVKVDAVAEHRIVALGALQTAYKEGWRARVYPDIGYWVGQAETGSIETEGQTKLIDDAIKDYIRVTQASWPPSEEELDAFERSLKGIRLGGDVAVLSDRAAAESPNLKRPQRKGSGAKAERTDQ